MGRQYKHIEKQDWTNRVKQGGVETRVRKELDQKRSTIDRQVEEFGRRKKREVKKMRIKSKGEKKGTGADDD